MLLTTRHAFLLCALVPFCGLLSGCPLGSELDNSQQQFGLRNDCAPVLLEQNCSGPTCHGKGAKTGGIDLLSPGLPERLLNQPATYPRLTDCPSPPELLIDSQSPESSLLLRKVEGRQQCGDAMPPDSDTHPEFRLSDEELACLSEWVFALATGEGAAGPL